jgi:hypothetical protein
LHTMEGASHVYLVDDGVAVYRHRLGGPVAYGAHIPQAS